MLYRTDKDGAYTIFESLGDDQEYQTVVFPLKVGNQWKFTVGDRTSTVTVVGYETVDIGYTTYWDCLHLHLERADGDIHDTWSDRGVGLVKSTITTSTGTTMITLKELKAAR